MRRLGVLLVSCAVLACTTGAGVATAGRRAERIPSGLRRDWIEWAFGSSTNPLLQENFCGERVGDTFFLTVTAGAPDVRIVHCRIPAGVPILVPPGGVISWAPTDGRTDSQLFQTTARQLESVILESVKVKLDGEPVPVGRLFVSDPFNLDLEPGNLIQEIDPNVTGDSTRVMFAYWFVYIPRLSSGSHLLVTSDKFQDVGLFRTRFHINVGSS
jgi:hypothetical protein